MRAPLSWLKEYVDIPKTISADDIAEGLVRVGFEVEAVEIIGADVVDPVVVGSVLSIEEITEFKKPIRWVSLDCGEKSTRFVICGATNFMVGDLVAVALPGSVLPGGFAIAQRETYGKVSNGMICSSKELALSQDHEGILVLPPQSGKPGDDALKLLETSDVIFDIAVNPDRGYALSMRGIAREIAGSLGLVFEDPASQVALDDFAPTKKGVQVHIDDASAVSVIYIRTFDNFDSQASSPVWMRRRIEKCGMRSISLAVDITNYVMLELGQPLHAFDREKIQGDLHIRRAGKSSSLTTLDGQVRALNSDDLLVADEKQPLALAGTMGGRDSEVTTSTRSIALEAARFDPISIARNSRRHKLSSEASRRLERGVDPALAQIASARAGQLFIDLAGANHVGSATSGKSVIAPTVVFDPHFVATFTGAEISSEVVAEKLHVIGCSIEKSSEILWRITPASWRSDLQTPADLVEEVARMVGYDAIPSLLPPRPISPGLTDAQQRRRAIATLLADNGLVEVQTYPFVSDVTMKVLGFQGDRAKTFRLANPMSEDAPNLRVHLIPGLLDAAVRNMSRGARNFGLFEMGSIFRNNVDLPPITNPATDKRPSQKQIDAIYSGVPVQFMHVAGVLVGNSDEAGWQGKSEPYKWTDAIAFAESVLRACNFEWTIERSDFAPWHPGRCAELRVGSNILAHAGELHPRVVAAYGLPERSCAFAVNLSVLPERSIVRGKVLGNLPVAVQDIALIVDSSVSAARVEAALRSGAGELLESIELFDRYDKVGDGKVSLAFTMTFRALDRTLTSAEVSMMRESAAQAAFKQTGAIVRSA